MFCKGSFENSFQAPQTSLAFKSGMGDNDNDDDYDGTEDIRIEHLHSSRTLSRSASPLPALWPEV